VSDTSRVEFDTISTSFLTVGFAFAKDGFIASMELQEGTYLRYFGSGYGGCN
jgi:hypothetical protein